jgi:hypothetical protein
MKIGAAVAAASKAAAADEKPAEEAKEAGTDAKEEKK